MAEIVFAFFINFVDSSEHAHKSGRKNQEPKITKQNQKQHFEFK